MAEWKVSRQHIRLFPHPNADRLELANVGGYQVVTEKGLYKNDQVVVFIPEKSVLPDTIAEPFRNYLAGPKKDRVKSVKLRKELSCGIIIPDEEKYQKYVIDKDFSQDLGITKYEPPIPQQLAGEVDAVSVLETSEPITKHDVEQFNIYSDEFKLDESIIVTEKIHGTQVNVIRTVSGKHGLSSKGLISRDLLLRESEKNTYWQAVKNVGLFELLDKHYPFQHVQAIGEVVPVQKGFHYGFSKPSLLLFDIRKEGVSLLYDAIHPDFLKLWVPTLYRGKYKGPEKLRELRTGKETVSGKHLHIREGIVVRPLVDRRVTRGFRLMLKLINPRYTETGDEIN